MTLNKNWLDLISKPHMYALRNYFSSRRNNFSLYISFQRLAMFAPWRSHKNNKLLNFQATMGSELTKEYPKRTLESKTIERQPIQKPAKSLSVRDFVSVFGWGRNLLRFCGLFRFFARCFGLWKAPTPPFVTLLISTGLNCNFLKFWLEFI